jgi:ADP-heptose:LPS heptosyltransferase
MAVAVKSMAIIESASGNIAATLLVPLVAVDSTTSPSHVSPAPWPAGSHRVL